MRKENVVIRVLETAAIAWGAAHALPVKNASAAELQGNAGPGGAAIEVVPQMTPLVPVGPNCPTPEPTEVPPPTPTEEIKPSSTPMPKPTETPIPPTETPEPTKTVVILPSPTPMPTKTQEPSPTPKETQLPSPTPLLTETAAPTPVITITQVPSPTATETAHVNRPTKTPETMKTAAPDTGGNSTGTENGIYYVYGTAGALAAVSYLGRKIYNAASARVRKNS